MANYIIAGKECEFRGIPFSTLQSYAPIQRTHYALWKTSEPLANVYLNIHLNMLAHIRAIDRLQPITIDGGYNGALWDYESGTTRLMTDFENYLRILTGTSHILECPWAKKNHQDAEEHLRNLAAMDDAILQHYRTTPRLLSNPQARAIINDTLKTTEEINQQTAEATKKANGKQTYIDYGER